MRVGAEHGFTMFEYDVKLSRDNVLVLMHDDDVDRTSNGHGPAAAKDYIELAQLDFGGWHSAAYAGEPLPTFAAVARYTVANGIASNVEIKPRPGREAETGRAVALAARELWKQSTTAPAFLRRRGAGGGWKPRPSCARAAVEKSRPTGWRACRNTSAWRWNINQKDATRERSTPCTPPATASPPPSTIRSARSAARSGASTGIFTDELAAIRPVQA